MYMKKKILRLDFLPPQHVIHVCD